MHFVEAESGQSRSTLRYVDGAAAAGKVLVGVVTGQIDGARLGAVDVVVERSVETHAVQRVGHGKAHGYAGSALVGLDRPLNRCPVTRKRYVFLVRGFGGDQSVVEGRSGSHDRTARQGTRVGLVPYVRHRGAAPAQHRNGKTVVAFVGFGDGVGRV